MQHGPEHYAEQARKAAKAGRYIEAAQFYRQAQGATVGHKRAERYYEAAQECERRAAAGTPPIR